MGSQACCFKGCFLAEVSYVTAVTYGGCIMPENVRRRSSQDERTQSYFVLNQDNYFGCERQFAQDTLRNRAFGGTSADEAVV